VDIAYVDKDDRVIGAGPISGAYEKGIRVRIARVFITNSKGELLIQRRSDNHKSLPGRWDHAAAGHVDDGESYLEAAKREMAEEMGIEGVGLHEVAKFYSEEDDEKTYTKKRFNTIFMGAYDGPVRIDEKEVSDYRWISDKDLNNWIEKRPNDFTNGFLNAYRLYRQSSGKALS